MTESSSGGQEGLLRPDQFVERLRRALGQGGDFPASAKVVTELKTLTNQPETTANQIAEVILREPSLGVRVLHLVNSSFYRRAKPVTTISQAIVQVGMKPLADMCAGLILLQKFVPEARKSSAFATCLHKSVLTSILTSSLTLNADPHGKSSTKRDAESGYLAGMLAEMGVLLLGYYFPKVYESAVKRGETKGVELDQSIHQIVGLSPYQISVEVIKTLNLPPIYADIIGIADKVSRNVALPPNTSPELAKLGKTLCGASFVSTALSSEHTDEQIQDLLQRAVNMSGLPSNVVQTSLHSLPSFMGDYYAQLEMSVPNLPVDPTALTVGTAGPGGATSIHVDLGRSKTLPELEGQVLSQFEAYLDEIKAAIADQEPTASIVTTVMEVCAYCLNFDKVILLLASPSKKSLIGRMMLGEATGVEPTKINRTTGTGANPHAPDNVAFVTGRPAFQGESIFGDGWPLAAIPVGSGKRSIGVIYAERSKADRTELSSAEQAAIVMLTELLDKSLQRTAAGN